MSLLIIAHRGLTANTNNEDGIMENTIDAVREAVRIGYTAAEVDVQLTADMVPVLWHDNAVYGSDKSSMDLTRSTYSECKTYIKSHVLCREDGKLWEPSKKRMVTLEAMLTKFPHMSFNLEIKIAHSRKRDVGYKQKLCKAVADVVQRTGHRHIVYSSFDITVCKMLACTGRHIMLLTEKQLEKAAYTARKYGLDGVVFDGTKLQMKKTLRLLYPELSWWSYNACVPLTSACIMDHFQKRFQGPKHP